MAHWAELDDNNIVTRVLVTDNNDQRGDEGYQWLLDTFSGRWVKTSYNGRIRYNFAGPGYVYDEEADAFIAPKPDGDYVLDTDTFTWKEVTNG
jgi:hypothetical protein